MTDDEIRALVRAAIARHLEPSSAAPVPAAIPRAIPAPHPSLARYSLIRAADDTMCLIEPAVTCNQCGFCQCHGH